MYRHTCWIAESRMLIMIWRHYFAPIWYAFSKLVPTLSTKSCCATDQRKTPMHSDTDRPRGVLKVGRW